LSIENLSNKKMPTGKGFIDKEALNYILSLISSNESKEAKLLREETKKHRCAQMISKLEKKNFLKTKTCIR